MKDQKGNKILLNGFIALFLTSNHFEELKDLLQV